MNPHRNWLAGVVLGALIGGTSGALVLEYAAPGLSEADVRSIVDQKSSEAGGMAVPAPDISASIESYLMANPQLLERMSEKLRTERETSRRAELKAEIDALGAVISDGDGAVEVGNPVGDVTLIEMYDYNCGFCRSTLPDIATLLAEDK